MGDREITQSKFAKGSMTFWTPRTVRRRYRSVEAESFGLSVKKILKKDDKDLRQMVSMKAYAPYVSGPVNVYQFSEARKSKSRQVQRGLEGGNMKSEMFRFRRVY